MKAAAVAIALAALLSGGAALAEEAIVVEIKDFAFNPQTVTAKVGQTIRWENNEKRQYHNVWFEALGEPEPQIFFPEESYERSFDAPGEYPYRCGPHPEMTGLIKVVE